MSDNDRLCALQMRLEGQPVSAIAQSLDTTPAIIRSVLSAFGVSAR